MVFGTNSCIWDKYSSLKKTVIVGTNTVVFETNTVVFVLFGTHAVTFRTNTVIFGKIQSYL